MSDQRFKAQMGTSAVVSRAWLWSRYESLLAAGCHFAEVPGYPNAVIVVGPKFALEALVDDHFERYEVTVKGPGFFENI